MKAPTLERSPGSSKAHWRLLLVGLALNALLVVPAWWRDGAITVWMAPEAWLVPLLLSIIPRRAAGWLRAVAAAAVAFVIIAGVFDGLVQSVLSRPLNVFIDPLMLRAGFHVIEGSFGFWAALLCSVAAALLAVVIVWSVDRSLRIVAERPRLPTALAWSLSVGLLAISIAQPPGVQSQVRATAGQQWHELEETRTARRRLLAAEDDPLFQARALPGLAGRDVYVVFIESYGVAVLDDARYRVDFEPRLLRWRSALAESGLHSVSGRFVAPIRGGQSWLSHATLLSGLPIDNQLWYETLLERDIDLLSDDFRATGHVTFNVAPAIVMDWPEGRKLGFDRVIAADDLGYAGPKLGWVTMPDEYTLHALGQDIRPQVEAPVFAQVALISSHWPWYPVLRLSDAPERIGRGEIYAEQTGSERRPLSARFDPRTMRRDYPRSLGYSIDATMAWAARSLPGDALLIVLGDHQPVSLVTGRGASASVPVHVISGDPELLQPFTRRGFSAGLLPEASDASAPMHELRHWLRAAFDAR